jgi:hypothetical protein
MPISYDTHSLRERLETNIIYVFSQKYNQQRLLVHNTVRLWCREAEPRMTVLATASSSLPEPDGQVVTWRGTEALDCTRRTALRVHESRGVA